MRLSIITINFNNLQGLKKTFDSVRCQTWKDYEWIIIDGGSTDGSKEFIVQNSKYFTFWCSEHDNGVYDAQNKGISHAKGEYLSFLNSGDVFASDTVLKNVFGNNKYTETIIYGDWVEVGNSGTSIVKAPQEKLLFYLYYRNICHQAMFIKSHVFLNTGYDTSYRLYADWAKWVNLLLEGHSYRYIPVIICNYDMNGMSTVDNPIVRSEFIKIRSMFPFPISEIIANLYGFESQKTIVKGCKLVYSQSVFSFIYKVFVTILFKLFKMI